MVAATVRPPQLHELEAMYRQRWQVLRQPLGMPPGSERDARDHEADHLVAVVGDRIVGSARLSPLSAQVGGIAYVAVSPEFSRQGIGTQLMQALIERGRQAGFQRLEAKVRLPVLAFYQKLGFRETSERFAFLGIPHVWMALDLD
ncbi:MAG: GNAT family N-acetyltransferase [Cyanobacteria bacterium QS_8_64_29]|nr:MAG: GNAT family N-acetyltransferase [Cyanobacteria bacterium QS_8_64_29]